LVASAVDASVAKTVVAKNTHRHEDEAVAKVLKEDPTVIPGINDVAKAEDAKDRDVASVKEAPKETAERQEWINSLKEARDASRHLENTSELSKFIQAQQASNMACHAKQLEAKRTLDGLATKVMLLSDEIEGQESVIAGQNKIVKDMLEQGSRSAESKKSGAPSVQRGLQRELGRSPALPQRDLRAAQHRLPEASIQDCPRRLGPPHQLHDGSREAR
jgi:hypothetical protein